MISFKNTKIEKYLSGYKLALSLDILQYYSFLILILLRFPSKYILVLFISKTLQIM